MIIRRLSILQLHLILLSLIFLMKMGFGQMILMQMKLKILSEDLQ